MHLDSVQRQPEAAVQLDILWNWLARKASAWCRTRQGGVGFVAPSSNQATWLRDRSRPMASRLTGGHRAERPCRVQSAGLNLGPMATQMRQVAFLTNHARVVLALAAWPDLTIRQLAERVGITERATYALLRELEHAGYLSRRREGKLVIALRLDMALSDPLLRGRTLDDLVGLVRRSTRK